MLIKFNEIQLGSDSERLIILRKRLGLSQFQLAKELGISLSYLGQIERDELPFTPQLKGRIDKYLNWEKELYEEDLCNNY